MRADVDDRDERMAEIVAEALAQLRAGGELNIAEWRTRYPDLADDLAARLQTARAVETALNTWRDAPADPSAPTVCPGPDGPAGIAAVPQAALSTLGRYRIQETLGAGGMGTVYKAYDPQLERTVAVKVPHFTGPIAAQQLDRQRFLREARVAASLRHPHICPLYDVGEENGVPYVVMAFVEGSSLAVRLKTQGRCEDCRAAVTLARQVAEALAAVHEHGIVHRDLKPGNILLDVNGQAVLTDFGLARPQQSAEQLTAEGAFVGTPAYMDPEQFSATAGPAGPATDIYGLGVVLYQMLTNQLPFEGELMTLLYRIAQETPPPPSHHRPDLPPALEAIVLKAMARRPVDRYPSARTFADELGAWLAAPVGEAALLRQQTPPSAPPRRRRLVWTAVALLLVLVGGGLLLPQIILRITGKDGQKRDVPLNEGDTIEVVKKPAENGKEAPNAELKLSPGASSFDRFQAKDIPEAERFDWQPKELVAVLGVHHRRHWGGVLGIASSPDGKKVASLGRDKIRLWDVATGSEQAAFGRSASHATSCLLAFSPDGRTLAAIQGGYVSDMDLLEVATGRRLASKSWEPNLVSVAYSPDGRKVAYGFRDGVKIRDVVLEKTVASLTWPESGVRCLAFSPDGKKLAAGDTGGRPSSVKIWDLMTGNEQDPVSERTEALSFSRDGSLLAYGAGGEGLVFWDIAAGKPLTTFSMTGSVKAVAFSPDARTLASANEGSEPGVTLWDVATRTRRARIRGAGSQAIAFSEDGKVFASVSSFSVLFWDATVGTAQHTLSGHKGAGRAVTYSVDGQLLATCGEDGKVKLWDATTDKVVLTIDADQHEIHCVAISPDRKTVVSGSRDGTIKLWDAKTGNPQRTIAGHLGGVLGLAFAPDGKTLISASKDGTVKLWDPATGKLRDSLTGHTGAVHAVAYSHDGKAIVTGGDDKTARLWDAATGKELAVFEGHMQRVAGVAFAPDGKTVATASEDGTARVWDVATGKERFTLTGHDKAVRSVAFAPDGKTLATGGEDGTVKLWLADSDLEWITLHGHKGPVWSVAFSPDGQSIASAGQDGKVLVRQTAKQVPGWEYPPKTAEVLAISPDCKTMVTSRWGGKCHLVDVVSGKERPLFLPDSRGTNGIIASIKFLDGKTLLIDAAVLLDLTTGKKPYLEGMVDIHYASRSHDGKRLVAVQVWGSVCVWDLNSGKQIASLPGRAGHTVISTKCDGTSVIIAAKSAGGEVTITVWDIATAKERYTLKIPQPFDFKMITSDCKAVMIQRGAQWLLWDVVADKERGALPSWSSFSSASPDGKTVLLEDRSPTDPVVYDTTTGQLRATLKGHLQRVRHSKFSDDSKLLATLGEDNRAILWDVASGKQLRSWTLPGVCNSVLFAPDGRHLVLNNSNGTAYVLRLAEPPR